MKPSYSFSYSSSSAIRVLLGALLVLGLGLASAAEATTPVMPRHPAPSPDGSTIAFSWQGDLWTVPTAGGEARRLTVHPGTDRHPVWSPDGRWIAFASDRHGGTDIFLLATDGAQPPRRLSHHSAGDRPVDFLPDSSAVVFTSRRGEGIRRSSTFWVVGLEGGTPYPLMDALGRWGTFSPDGSTFAFVRGTTRWNRTRYRGAANRDLWLWQPADGSAPGQQADGGSYRQLTTFDGDDDLPTWLDDSTLVGLSSRSGRKNLFAFDTTGGEARQLTDHQDYGIRFPRAAANGSVVAYEQGKHIWTLDPAGGDASPLSIEVSNDLLVNPQQRLTHRDDAAELAVHPDGELVALVVGGDLFLTAVVDEDDREISPPPTLRLTHTPEREQDIAFSADGNSLYFASRQSGNLDIYRLWRADEELEWIDSFEFKTEAAVASPAEEGLPTPSPDGERLAYQRGKGDLMLADLSSTGAVSGEPRALFEHWQLDGFQWSPDGRWLTYSKPDLDYNSEIYLHAVKVEGADSTPYNVSRHPREDESPHFSPDGRRLLWTSPRHDQDTDLWGVWLSREDDERTPEGWLRLFREQEDGDQKSEEKSDGDSAEQAEGDDEKGEDSDSAESQLPDVQIDFDGLWERVQALTDLRGEEGSPRAAEDGRRVIFTAQSTDGDAPDLYSVRWDGQDLQQLTEGGVGPRQITLLGEHIFYLDDDGRAHRREIDEGGDNESIPFAARRVANRRAEKEAVFDEAWLTLGEWFYDPDFHGVDWPTTAAQYRPWVTTAGHRSDFVDGMNLMLGELNASHMGYFEVGDSGDAERTGLLGASFDPAAGGPGLLITEVLPGSPAARVDVGLAVGDRLLAIDGEEVDANTNVWSLLTDTVGQKVRLTVLSASGERRGVTLEPISQGQLQALRYDQWVRERRQLVESLSEGRLGYLHIQAMNISSFEEFERNLFAAGHGKEGLVIDVRSNGGGWTTDYLMAALNVERHARTVPRDADPQANGYPQDRLPLASWPRPAITVADQESYSNAEIFSHAFKTLGRGLVVGQPTFGAVISTGAARLANGAFLRLPLRGWYVAGSDLNMENNGAVPDLLVPLPPQQDLAIEDDDQLEAAVRALLEGLEEDPRYGSW
ncbi:MAG: S41 family peptidase [Acidobacteriota bacterium]